jgi:hypothetical protein
VDALTLFGLFAVTAMLVTYAFESRNHWFILAFAAACVLGSIYGFLQGVWPFGLVRPSGRSSPCVVGICENKNEALSSDRQNSTDRKPKMRAKNQGTVVNQARVALRQSLLTTILFVPRHSELSQITGKAV